MSYRDVREPVSGKLLFRFDAERDTIEIQRRGIKTVVYLKAMKENAGERRTEDDKREFPEEVS